MTNNISNSISLSSNATDNDRNHQAIDTDNIATEGVVGIVYVDQSLYPGMAPRINELYRIVKAWSAQEVPEIGAQLRRRYGERTFLCGWVRKEDNRAILKNIEKNMRVYGRVTDTEPFWWLDVQCYWGTMEWWAKEEESANATRGGQIVEERSANSAEGGGGGEGGRGGEGQSN